MKKQLSVGFYQTKTTGCRRKSTEFVGKVSGKVVWFFTLKYYIFTETAWA